MAFASLKEEGPLPTAYIAKTVKAPMKRVRWDKQGKSCLPCRNASDFVVGCPITFQGQNAFVTDNQNNHISVDRPFKLRGNDMTLRQKQFYYDTQRASDEVVATWNSFLQRDRDTLTDEWDEAESIVSLIPQQEVIQIPDYSVELWRRTQAHTSLKSARGSCGFTVCEMRNLPDWCLELLFNLLRVIDETATWPAMWLYAFTIMLPKTSVPESPLDLRPITVMSRIYRQWSRFKAVSLLVGLASRVPNIIAGGTSTSSLMLSAHFQEILESESGDSECNGVTIDIIKCYNVIPRYPLSLMMYKLGWPIPLIKTYMAVLMNLQRSFQTLGSVSSWQKSYTGVPEGCALAVASMYTLSSSLYFYLQETSPHTELFTFADNWALLFQQIAHTGAGVNFLEKFCTALKLAISVPKSWIWALNPECLEQLGDISLQGCAIPTVKHTKDLGVDLTYQGVRRKTHLKHRLTLGLARCQKVQNAPRNKQGHMLQMGCFPKAGYGIELNSANKKEYNSFRTAAARAVGLSRKGASPWIALSFVSKINDFQFFALKRTVSFWRQYPLRLPGRKTHLIEKIQNKVSTGPVANLCAVCWEVGIELQGELAFSNIYGTFNWLLCSKKFLHHVLHAHWVQYACTRLVAIPRKHFNASFIDTVGFQKCLTKFDKTDQQMLRAHAAGTNYTNNARSKYLDIENKCPFCNCCDSRAHRVLECSGLEQERQALSPDTIDMLQCCSTFRHFGLVPLENQLVQIRRNFLSVPKWCDIEQSFLGIEYDQNHDYHIFTDGSCFNNGDQFLAIAASALVVFDGYLDPVYRNYHRSLLPSVDHSSYRAEVFALYMCCILFTNGYIYTDCQSALDTFHHILQCVASGCQPTLTDHCDLWIEIYQVVQRKQCRFKLIKVKAHSENDFHPTHDLQWKSYANAAVDLHAKDAILVDHHELYSDVVEIHRQREALRTASAEVMSFQVKIAWKAIQANSAHLSSQVATIVTGHGIVPTTTDLWINSLTEGQCHACKFNPEFLFRLAQWANTVPWDCASTHHTSFIEIMLSFIFSTKTFPPFPIRKYQNKANARQTKWVLRDQHPTMDFQNSNAGDLLSGFIRITNWCAKHLGVELFAGGRKPDVCSLTRYMYHGKAVGFRARAALPEQGLVDEYCNRHLPNRKVFNSPIPYNFK